MKLLKHIHIMAIVCMLLSFAACNETDEPVVFSTDPATLAIINEGRINMPAEGGTVELNLIRDQELWQGEMLYSSTNSLDWITIAVWDGEESSAVRVIGLANDGLNRRVGEIRLMSGSKRLWLEVDQMPKSSMQLDDNHIDIQSAGGDVDVKVWANVNPQMDTTGIASWLHFKRVETVPNDPDASPDAKATIYHFTADANAGLGRATTMTLVNENLMTQTVTIHQTGRKLEAEETIEVDEPGQLGTLLGGDPRLWQDLTNLTLKGKLNDTDMQALRHLLSAEVWLVKNEDGTQATSPYSLKLNLKHLDMHECMLIADGDEYHESALQAGPALSYHTKYNNQLATNAFKLDRMPLETIVLPDSLEVIGNYAFYANQNLQRIDIPATVKTIGSYAFALSKSLTQINIPENSQLETINTYAFYTNKTVDEIRLPQTVVINELKNQVFGNMQTNNLYVSWGTPPTLTRTNVARRTILHVPQGSLEAYRQAPGWNNAEQIEEY